jgi:eukaryotic-like serine/threonine-protein kinase
MQITSDNWERAKELFDSALELDSSERASFLAENCRDESLRQQVEKLLINYEEAGSFLNDPALNPSFPVLNAPAESQTEEAGRQQPGLGELLATATSAETEDPMVGRHLGAYKLVRRVGQGGMAAVFLAMRADDEYQKEVAVKLVRPGLDSQELLSRLRNERQTLAGLDHPNIVKLLDGGSTPEGLPFLVMDYVEGSPIDEYCDQHKLSVDGRLYLFDKVCDAVRYAHQKLVIHRDLKPSNILVLADGTPKLLDFGIAKVLNPEPAAQGFLITQTSTRCMTPAYASPEQMRGKSVTPATDIYSLGVVLYELLSGHRPYRLAEQTPAEMERAICEQEPETPSTAVSRVESDTSSDGTAIARTPELVSQTREGQPDKLRRRLRGDLDNIVLKALQKEPQRRYGSVAEFSQDIDRHLHHLPVKARPSTLAYRVSKFVQRHKTEVSAAVIVLVMVATLGFAGGMFFRSRQSHKLTEKDTIVLSDFTNTTGDTIYDDTLKQGLSVQLEQTPFLDLVSEQKVNETLKLMGHPAGGRLTPDVTREVCQRTGSRAMLTGSIAGLGSQYVIGLKAVNCNTGDVLAEAQEQAADKEDVLKALDAAAVSIRGKLGESLSSVQRYATPLKEATTPSLDALKAYSLGWKMFSAEGEASAIPFFKRAVELDADFAMAYRAMSCVYGDLNELGEAEENARKAWELREKVSEPERFSIEANYYLNATGELEKAAQVYELWQQAYPREFRVYLGLGAISAGLGDWEKTLDEMREALRLDPSMWVNYVNLGDAYTNLNRLDEADAVYKQATERKLAGESLLAPRYGLAFLKGDTAEMAKMEAAAMGKAGIEDLLLARQANTEAWYGKLKNARELTRRAMDSAQRNDAKETAAAYQAAAALREVESGNRQQARAEANAALKLAPNSQVRPMAALALARAGYTAAADMLAAELDRTSPLDTQVQRYHLPTIRAAIALQRKDPNQAVKLLKVAGGIELAGALAPAYLRGEAYLMLHDGNAAAAEYQKFIDHRGLVQNSFWGAVARLGLARAYALDAAKDPATRDKARAAYQDFLTLWKDADPNIPILKKAKAEYAKLQ